MGRQGAIRAGKAFVELFVDNNPLIRGLRIAETKLKRFGSLVRSFGADLAKATAIPAIALGLGAKTFASFEASMARVLALTNASGKEFDRLTAKARELGRSTVFSAKQAADAMGFFALAGFEVNEILQAIGPTLNLAAAGQLEIADAADITAKAMAGMGIEAAEVGRITDVLTKAMTTANTDLLQIGGALKFVGPLASAAGISLEEITAAIQLLSNAGLQAELAGTSLRGIILRLINPTKDADLWLRKLGVSIATATGDIRPFADIIGDLERSLKAMPPASRLLAIGQIFPARQAAAASILITQGADKLRRFTEALVNAGGTAERVAGVQLNTLAGDVTILLSALEGLGIAIGKSFVGPLRVLVTALKDGIALLSDWIGQNEVLIAGLAVATIVLGGISAMLIGSGIAFQVMAFAATGLIGILSILGGGLSFLISNTALFLGTLVAMGTVLVSATNIGLKAVGLLIDAAKFLKRQFTAMKEAVVGVLQGIVDALAAGDIKLATEVLWLGIQLAWTKGVGFLEGVWMIFRDAFIQIADDMFFGFSAAVEIAWHGMEVAWIETTTFLLEAWTLFSTGVLSVWSSVQNSLVKMWNELFALVDKDFDIEAANRSADSFFDQEIADREDAALDKLRALPGKRDRDLEKAKTEHEKTMANIGAASLARQEKRAAEFSKRVIQNEKDLVKARKKLDDVLRAARDRRAGAEGDEGTSWLERIKTSLGDFGDQMDRSLDIRGTFNAAAQLSLQGSGGDNPMVKAAQATTKEVEKFRKQVKNNQAVFG